jgi:hypothetical protein
LTRPPPPGSLAFRISSRESVAVQLQENRCSGRRRQAKRIPPIFVEFLWIAD